MVTMRGVHKCKFAYIILHLCRRENRPLPHIRCKTLHFALSALGGLLAPLQHSKVQEKSRNGTLDHSEILKTRPHFSTFVIRSFLRESLLAGRCLRPGRSPTERNGC